MDNQTLHIINTIPWSNLNRDDTNTPKRAIIGGVLRGMLSSQSIKRAVRNDYEVRSGALGIDDTSVRSANLAGIIANRAIELAAEVDRELDTKQALKDSKKLIDPLVKKEKSEKDTQEDQTNGSPSTEKAKESKTSSWLSYEEIETAASAVASRAIQTIVNGKEESIQFIDPGMTGSLSIAAFGRMFASSMESNTHSAIAVGPAIAVHKTVIETDYFSTVDDDPRAAHAGSSFLGVASYTSGVFYRSITIDRAQLRRVWTGYRSETARDQLTLMVNALVYGLPSGKKNATAPYVQPLLVLSEEQAHRTAYDFETPVNPGPDGGYGANAITALLSQTRAAREFDAENFGFATVAGTSDLAKGFEAEYMSLDNLIAGIVNWILP